MNALLGDELHVVHGHPFWLLGGRSFAAVVVIMIWRTWPFAFLTLTAGLQAVPTELHEAAAIDGAGYLRRLRSVTLPLLQLYGRIGLTITYLTFALPFSIWLIDGYFDTIPRELDESARVDGAGPLRTLLRVVLPVAAPGVVAVAIYAFMTAWGEVLFASVLTDDSTRTLAVGLRGYATQANVYWNQVMAASLVVSLPVVIGFLALQRFLVHGLTAGAVKS